MLVLYFVTFCFVIKFLNKNRLKVKEFREIKMKKSGVHFVSFFQHRIKILNKKFLQIGNSLYIKIDSGVVKISNVDNIFKVEEFLYFTALGNVDILLDCSKFYRYFNIKISSSKIDFHNLQQLALKDFISNCFEENFSKTFKNYINFIKNVLNINFFEKKLIIKQNKLKFSYILKYKLNNTIKKVYVNKTLEKN